MYVLEEVFSGGELLNDQNESRIFTFDLAQGVDTDCPAVIIIGATNVDYFKNRVALNGNFVGYLTPKTRCTVFEVNNNRYAPLKKTGNKIEVLACDRWGDRKSVANLNIDDFYIKRIDVAYNPS